MNELTDEARADVLSRGLGGWLAPLAMGAIGYWAMSYLSKLGKKRSWHMMTKRQKERAVLEILHLAGDYACRLEAQVKAQAKRIKELETEARERWEPRPCPLCKATVRGTLKGSVWYPDRGPEHATTCNYQTDEPTKEKRDERPREESPDARTAHRGKARP